MRIIIAIFSMLLFVGCTYTEAHKRQVDMGVQIGQQVIQEGAEPGSPLAHDVLIAYASLQTVVGKPETPTVYTSENVASTAAVLADEAKRRGIWNSIFTAIKSVAKTALPFFPGAAEALGLGGILAGLVELFRRNWKTIKKGREVGRALVEGIHEYKGKAKELFEKVKKIDFSESEEETIKAFEEIVINHLHNTIKKVHEGKEVREDIRKMIKEKEASAVKGGKV